MLTVRKARPSDLPAVVSLWKELSKHHAVFARDNRILRPHLSRRPDAAQNFARWARSYIGSKNGVVHLAEIGATPAGYSLIFIKRNPPVSKIAKIGYVSDLLVKMEFRGRGVSSALKNEAMKWFRQKGVKYVSLNVLADNRVPQSIYRKWGFFPFVLEMRKNL